MVEWVKRSMGAMCQYLISGVALLLLLQGQTTSAQASEAGLRVAFVYNFLKFIEWPERTGDDLYLCVLGATDVTRESLSQINNKSNQKATIRVLFLDNASDVEPQMGRCHLVYVPTTGADLPLPAALPHGVILVMDEPDQQDGRVAIALNRTREDRIEFQINEPAVKQAGVKVSSQLLKLAKKQVGGAR